MAMTLATARLMLREPESGDVDVLRAYHARNAGRFARWDPLPGDDPLVHAGWIDARRAEAQAGKPATFLAFGRDSREIAAIVSLTSFGSEPSSAMLSYSVDGSLEGAGYAFEAVGSVVSYAFAELGLERISAQYDPENVRSGRLLERLGFRNVAITAVIPGMEHLMRAHVLAVRDRPVEVTA
jgi:ribosomal-protein-alanine N-acetyltransferase